MSADDQHFELLLLRNFTAATVTEGVNLLFLTIKTIKGY